MKFSLSWVVGFGSECQGGRTQDPSWSDVESRLREVCKMSGSVTLETMSSSDFELLSLQVIADNGVFVMTLGEDDGEDYSVRHYFGDGEAGTKVDVLGDAVDASAVCTDFQVVVDIFSGFFEKGHVLRSLMA
ncbi:DUF6911 family protein [Ectopseudomonas composti]|uniref:DUF6911 family protein n=1 Tax=Ectopseudomonas composti TaxID=658457 RepID=UPI0012E39241|nr:hypothetical protein [Pseudomonas composti]